jgi:hypothetical protein
MFLTWLSSGIVALAVSNVLAQFATSKLGISFFRQGLVSQIPGLSIEIASAKTYDIIWFAFLVLIGLVLLLVNARVVNTKKKNDIYDFAYFGFSILIFLQSYFVRHSGVEILIFFAITQTAYILLKRLGWKINKQVKWQVVTNGILSGFYLLLITRMVATSFELSIGIMLLTIWAYIILFSRFNWKWILSPSHLFLILAIIWPWNIPVLIGVMVGTFIVGWALKDKRLIISEGVLGTLYFLVFITWLAYNPLFYFGNLDTVEEGFWLGWLQRLVGGQVLYKDATVFQPPILIWGMGLFTKITGFSIFSVRLYFQILKILGFFVLFFGVRKIVVKAGNQIFTMLLLLALSSTLVRNNVEIRVGFGIVGLLIFYWFLKTGKTWKLFVAGIITGISVFVSLEAGIAATVVGLLSAVFVGLSKKKWQVVFTWVGGWTLTTVVILGILQISGALGGFLNQMLFYTRVFSQGYFNLPIARYEEASILKWPEVFSFLSSQTIMFVFSALAFIGGLGILLISWKNKKLTEKSKLVGMMSLYGLILSRAALGRSDWFHLLFVLLIAIPILISVFEELEEKWKVKHVTLGLWIVIGLIVFRQVIQESFLKDQVFKLQSYGNISQTFKTLESPRAKIALDIDSSVEETDKLIKYIQEKTKHDEKIFAFPWKPEIYFLADRNNATSFDTPYSFFSEEYQEGMVRELSLNKPKLIIYNPSMGFGGMSVEALLKVQSFIQLNYKVAQVFGKDQVMITK